MSDSDSAIGCLAVAAIVICAPIAAVVIAAAAILAFWAVVAYVLLLAVPWKLYGIPDSAEAGWLLVAAWFAGVGAVALVAT